MERMFRNSALIISFSCLAVTSFSQMIGGLMIPSLESQYPAGSVFCASGPTAIVEVTNPTTGKTWMDRNLGASQAATSSTDAAAYGDLYQWGRRSDRHQCRNSATTTTLSSTDTPAHGSFIIAPSAPNDWRSPQNVNLWQGVNGVNNPCPSGFRIPTETELNDERLSWTSNNAAGAFASPLKLPLTGFRSSANGLLFDVGTGGGCWSKTISSSVSRSLSFNTSIASVFTNTRSGGLPIRCIKDTPASLGALDCGGANTTGTLIAGQASNGVSTSVPYTGGNGGSYSAQSISSTGVTGLTATLAAGSVNTGSGALVYTITGTPATAGTASFAISLGGQSCTLDVTVDPPPLAIGDYHQGGIVFYLDGNGGGLICAPYDQSSTAAWGCQGTATGSTPTNIGSGNQNTLAILIGCPGSPAANLCVNLNISGYNDWYLPSKDELNLMFQNRATINATANLNGGSSFAVAWYWSSSEFNQFTAWHQNFFNGVQAPNQVFKNNTVSIRAIRSF